MIDQPRDDDFKRELAKELAKEAEKLERGRTSSSGSRERFLKSRSTDDSETFSSRIEMYLKEYVASKGDAGGEQLLNLIAERALRFEEGGIAYLKYATLIKNRKTRFANAILGASVKHSYVDRMIVNAIKDKTPGTPNPKLNFLLPMLAGVDRKYGVEEEEILKKFVEQLSEALRQDRKLRKGFEYYWRNINGESQKRIAQKEKVPPRSISQLLRRTRKFLERNGRSSNLSELSFSKFLAEYLRLEIEYLIKNAKF